MKKSLFIVSFVALSSCLNATTINLSSSPTAPSFYGIDGVALDSSAGDTIQVGMFTSWNTASAISDLATMGFVELEAGSPDYSIGSIFTNPGKLIGTGTNSSASSFNNMQIYVVLTDGATGDFGIVSGTDLTNWRFPVHDGGLADVKNVSITEALINDTAGLVSVTGGFQISPVPEPSTAAALAGLAALGTVMVRRRRR